jgi:lysozyme
MADENISDVQRKLTAAMQQQAEDAARYGQMQVSTAEQLRDAQFQAATGMKNFSAASGMAGKTLGAIAGAGVAAAAAMYEGKKGMGAFNSSLDSLSEAATLAGAALTLLIPGGIVMKAIIGGLTMAATAAIAYTKAANDMSDKLYKSYSGLAKTGGAAADGMTGVFRDAKKLGLSMNELDSMVALVAANSQDLAMFAGTVAEGREKLADMSAAMEGSRAEFFKMGLSQIDINEGMGDYLRVVTRTGRAQTMTTEQLASSARNYITEQDQLAKITGISVKQQQANLEKAMANEMFLAKVRSLEAEGKFGAADELKKLNAYYSQMGEESAKGFQDSVNGNLRSKEAQKLNLASQGEVLRSTQEVIAGNATAAQAFDNVAGRVKQTEETIGRSQAAFGTTADSNLKYSEQVNFANAANGKSREQLEKATAAQIAKQKAGADEMTNNQGNVIKTQQEANEALERFTYAGIPNAQAAMEKLAKATLAAARVLQGLAEDSGSTGEGGVGGEQGSGAAPDVAAIAASGGLAGQLDADEKLKKLPEYEKTLAEIEKYQKLFNDGNKLNEKQLEGFKARSQIAAQAVADYNKKFAAPAAGGAAPSAAAPAAGGAAGGAAVQTPAAPAAPSAAAPAMAASASGNLRSKDAQKLNLAASSGQDGGAGKTGSNDMPAPKPATLKTASKGGGSSMSDADIKKMIEGHEGKKHTPYKDSEGLWTVGVGHLIGDGKTLPPEWNRTFSEEEVMAMFDKDYEKHKKQAESKVPGFSKYDSMGQAALIDLTFNMGPGWPKEFKNTAAKLGAGDTAGAADGLTNSKWYGQVGGRAPKIVGMVRNSEFTAEEGGAFSGPNSGYPATLHGDEAVIPLNNNSGNFVQLFEQMAMMMGQQAGSLDELVRIAKSGNDISNKILRQQA